MSQGNTRQGSYVDQVLDSSLVWNVDPTHVALTESKHKREGAEEQADFEACVEVGRRLLLNQFTFSNWVLRRVEKVQFASDRRISRRVSIEFRIPEDAPIVRFGDEAYWLIPLTVMRRHTLVNLDLRDEEGRGISLLGLRFTQKLDESMLRAAARLASPRIRQPRVDEYKDVDEFINDVVSGTWLEVQARLNQFEAWRDPHGKAAGTRHPLHDYFVNDTFRATLERMWRNFTLYVTLPVGAGRHRVLMLAFEEQVRWRYQLPHLASIKHFENQPPSWVYKPIAKGPRLPRISSFLGWGPTRIRFLTPSAENCASYHFEFKAPSGLWVTSAAFVGGRPNVDAEGVTPWDSIASTGHSAGLHAIEVPNGSLCRAQVCLRVPARGGLSTLLVACLAVVVALATAAWHARLYGTAGHWTSDQVTNIVLLLVTVCAGASTYVAQHSSGDVAARMLSGLRIAGVIVLSLPAVAAISLVFIKDRTSDANVPTTYPVLHAPNWVPDALVRFVEGTPSRDLLLWWLTGLSGISVAVTTAVFCGWLSSLIDARSMGRSSPWDMTTVDEERRWVWRRGLGNRRQPISGHTMSFHDLISDLGLAKPAIGVYSAEGWHERYNWSDAAQDDALELLQGEHNTAPQSLCVCDPLTRHGHAYRRSEQQAPRRAASS